MFSESLKICVPEGTQLAGFAGAARVSSKRAALEVNVVLLETRNSPFGLISIDVLYVGHIRQNFYQNYPEFNNWNLIFCATHTHFAPGTEPILAKLGGPDYEFVEQVSNEIASSLGRALRSANDVTCSVKQGVVRRVVSRRGSGLKIRRKSRWVLELQRGVGWRPKRVDDPLRTFQILELRTRVTCAVIVIFACHPTMSPELSETSPDYVDDVRKMIREKMKDKSTPVVFLQSFSADLRPEITSFVSGSPPLNILENLLNLRRGFRGTSSRVWSRWLKSILSDFEKALSSPELKSFSFEPSDIRIRSQSKPLNLMISGAPPSISFEMHSLWISDQAHFILMTGEVSSGYRSIVEEYFDHPVFTVAYINRTSYYLPTSSEISDGGYEASSFYSEMGLAWRPSSCEAQVRQFLSDIRVTD